MTSRTDRTESREDRRAARRDQLLDDAMAAIREIGPGATMEQLARRGGVTKPILYRHFGDRDGLITVIAERFAAELLGEIESALQPTEPTRQELLSTHDRRLPRRSSSGSPSLYRFLVQPGPHPTPRPRRDQPARRQHRPPGGGGDRRAAAPRRPRLRRPPSPWAYGIVGMVHQAGDWWLEDRTMSRRPLTDYLATSSGTASSAAAAASSPRRSHVVGWSRRCAAGAHRGGPNR